MNKGVIFLLGLLTGAVAGSAGTYFLTKNKIEDEAAAEIEAYAEHCKKKVDEVKKKYESVEEDIEENTDAPNEPIREDISNNEGVKKYHSVFKEANDKVTEGEKALKREEEGVISTKKTYIISEDQYTTEATMYDKVTLEFYCGDDTIVISDNGYGLKYDETIEQHFDMGREDIIPPEAWRYGQDNIGKSIFVRNDDLATDFEILTYEGSFHDASEEL